MSGSIRLKASSLGDLAPGDTFHLTHATSGLNALLYRALSITIPAPDAAEVTVEFTEERGYLNDDDYTPPPDTPVTPTTYFPENIDGVFFAETPYGFQKEEHTHFQMLVARGDTVTTRVRSWGKVQDGSYEAYRATSTFALRCRLEGALNADGFTVDEDNGLELTMVSPDKVPKVTGFTEAWAGRSVLFLNGEIFLVWGASLVSADRYSFSYVRAAYGGMKEDHADQDEGWLIFPTPDSWDNWYLTLEYGQVGPPGKSFDWKFTAELLGVTSDLATATVYTMTATCRAYLPLRPLNLTANGDGHCPTYGTGQDVVVDWDMGSQKRAMYPVEEDAPDGFAEWTKLQMLDIATETVQWEDTVATTGNHTITNAEIQAALGSEASFILRAYNMRGGLESLTYEELTVTKV